MGARGRKRQPVAVGAIVASIVMLNFSASASADRGLTQTQTICDGTWQVQRSANIGSDSASLKDVSGISSTDVWAVGFNLSTSHEIIEHWDGSRWTVSSTPGVGDSSGLNAGPRLARQPLGRLGAIQSASKGRPSWSGGTGAGGAL